MPNKYLLNEWMNGMLIYSFTKISMLLTFLGTSVAVPRAPGWVWHTVIFISTSPVNLLWTDVPTVTESIPVMLLSGTESFDRVSKCWWLDRHTSWPSDFQWLIWLTLLFMLLIFLGIYALLSPQFSISKLQFYFLSATNVSRLSRSSLH